MRDNDNAAVRMLGNNLIGPRESLVPRLEFQAEDQKSHPACSQIEVVVFNLPFFSKMQMLLAAEMWFIERIACETQRWEIDAKTACPRIGGLSVLW